MTESVQRLKDSYLLNSASALTATCHYHGMAQDSAKSLPRHYGAFDSHWPRFLHCAGDARDRARQVEKDYPRAAPLPDSLTAILFSAIAAEAFINELAEGASRDMASFRGLSNESDFAHLGELASALELIEDSNGPTH